MQCKLSLTEKLERLCTLDEEILNLILILHNVRTQFECKCMPSCVENVLIFGTVTIWSGNKFHNRMAHSKKEW